MGPNPIGHVHTINISKSLIEIKMKSPQVLTIGKQVFIVDKFENCVHS